MYVSDLALTDFRSYEHVVLSLEPGITALVGPNGQGKTNLVEAIAYLSTFGSHRVAGDTALVRAGTPRAVVQAKVIKGERPMILEVEIIAGRANRARLNRAPARPRDLLGHLRTVLFAPEDLALIKGDPGGRRRFLDDLLVLFSPRLASVRAEYDRVIKQRNALLKSAGAARRRGASADLGTLDIWDAKAAKAGAELTAARVRLLIDLRPHLHSAYEAVSGSSGQADTFYSSSLEQRDEDIAEESLTDAALVEARLLEAMRSEEHTSELQSRGHLVCRLLLDRNKRAAAKGCLNYSRRGDPASGRGTAGWRRLRKSPAATCSAISECTV